MYLTYLLQLIKLTRAHIGIAVLPSFFLGTLFALLLDYELNPIIFICGFIIIFLLYAAASYANDYYDFEADKFNQQFGFSGGSGVLQKYPQLKNVAKWGAIIMLLTAIILTTILALITYIPFWSFGFIAIGVFFAWFYSAPPIKLVYRGFSEMPHFIAGIMNAGWGYLLVTGILDLPILIFSIPLALYLFNIILIFEIPDVEADIHGDKTNLIVRYGRHSGFFLISLFFWAASIYFFVLGMIGWLNGIIDFLLLSLISLFPSMYSSYVFLKNIIEKNQATRYAIKTAFSLFSISLFFIIYFLIII
jgi:1,4-dihydroxy-2-naphthoate octaprenyltransferase